MNNNKFYKIGAVISVVLIAIVITFIVLAKKQDNKIAQEQEEFPSVMSSSNIVESEDVSSEENQFQEIATVDSNTTNTESANKTSDKNTTENKSNENATKTSIFS